MLNIFKRMNNKDFASVPILNQVDDIVVPVITLEKYPEIAKRLVSLGKKLADKISETDNRPIDKVLEDLSVVSLLQNIQLIIEVASDEFFELVAFIFDITIERVRKMGLVQLTKLLYKAYEVNEYAEVKSLVQNFKKALMSKK